MSNNYTKRDVEDTYAAHLVETYLTECASCGIRKDICNCKQTIVTTPIVKPASLLSPAEFSNQELTYIRLLLVSDQLTCKAEYRTKHISTDLINRINSVLSSRLGGF